MIDTHCHIDEEAFATDREKVILRQQQSGVHAMIVPGVNVASIESVLDVCCRHPGYCYPALGLHPEDVKADWEEQLAVIENAIRTHRPFETCSQQYVHSCQEAETTCVHQWMNG